VVDRIVGQEAVGRLRAGKTKPILPIRGNRGIGMLTWAFVFLIVAIIAGLLGFGGVASTATGIAKVLFFLFLVIFLVTTIASLFA
jgi:uncharacterized membrane protein YtjA (UPF0391 family)